ncbi:2Fe-2S iron-sulfur cluster-binding protein [Paraburkholderia xenovorans]
MSSKQAELTQGEVDLRGSTRESYTIRFSETGETYRCSSAETLLQSMARLGRRGIPTGCLNGGCGVCKVEVCRGCVSTTGPMSRTHVSAQEEAEGVVLACRVAPRSDIELRVVGKMRKAVIRNL